LAKNSFGRALRGLLPQLRTTGAGAKRDHVGVALSETGQSQFDALLDERIKGVRFIRFIGWLALPAAQI
jgi:hypothetical protein